jgi:aryl-alcohol dehydrogenase-like predicted oxidoreductase
MQYSSFAKTGRKVSRLGFGAMGLGGTFGKFNESEGIGALLNYLESGGNFIDTARHYGNSEEIIGKALKQWKGEPPFIATKIQSHGIDNTRWAIPSNVDETFPKKLIRQNTEDSLRLLGVERIDCMQLHLYWPNWGVKGYWLDELVKLKDEGKIGSIGVSLPDHRCDIGLPLVLSGGIDAVQVIINIFDPLALDCLVPTCKENNVAVIARCILDEGGLTGTLDENTTFEAQDFRNTYFDYMPRKLYIERINQLKKFIPSEAGSLARLAIKFVLSPDGVTTAIASMHLKKYLADNLQALEESPLSEESFRELRTRHRWIKNLYTDKYWQKNDLDIANEAQTK